EFVGFSFAVAPGRACYVPLGHRAGSGFDFSDGVLEQVPLRPTLDLLKPLLEDPAILKIGQNLKYDCLVLRRYGIKLAPIDDTLLISYALHATSTHNCLPPLSHPHLRPLL